MSLTIRKAYCVSSARRAWTTVQQRGGAGVTRRRRIERMSERDVYGDVVVDQINEIIGDYGYLLKCLRGLVGDVAKIGEKRGYNIITAKSICIDFMQVITRNTPSLTGLMRAVIDYENNVPKGDQS